MYGLRPFKGQNGKKQADLPVLFPLPRLLSLLGIVCASAAISALAGHTCFVM